MPADTCHPIHLDSPGIPHLAGAGVRIKDTLLAQVHELAVCRRPSESVDLAVSELLGGRAPDELGSWIHFPWANTACHILVEPLFVELRTNRNRSKVDAGEQEALRRTRIGVVGLSAGGAIATTLALEGVGGLLRIADPDALGLSNLNRLAASVLDLGLPKTVIAARRIAEIDPYLRVETFDAGVTSETMDAFFEGGLDLVIEECDAIAIKVEVRRRARELGVPVLMATSERGLLDVERFDTDRSLPLLHGLLENIDPGADRVSLVERIIGPLDPRTELSLQKVGTELASWPQLASDVVLGAASVTQAARRILLGASSTELRSGRYSVTSTPIL